MLINCLILFLLIVIIMQDFKHRLISWPLIPLLLVCFIVNGLQFVDAEELVMYVLLNNAFVFLQLLAFSIYISVKNKKPINIINTYIGIGDILFFVVLTAAFSPINFIAFYVSSLIFTLVFSLVGFRRSPIKEQEIPLAGIISIILIPIIIQVFWPIGINYYSDHLLLNWLSNSIL